MSAPSLFRSIAPAARRAGAMAAHRAMAVRAMSTDGRPFRILGLQQIAVGAEVKDEMTKIWQGQFGLKKHGDFQSEKENVDEDILKVGKGILGTVEVDIMAPLDKTKSPKVRFGLQISP
eukprot:44572-Rhodomonas_salina.3